MAHSQWCGDYPAILHADPPQPVAYEAMYGGAYADLEDHESSQEFRLASSIVLQSSAIRQLMTMSFSDPFAVQAASFQVPPPTGTPSTVRIF